jgi:calmodulin
VLKKAFDAFDREKKGSISTDMIGTIFEMLGIQVSDEEMEEIIEEVDSESKQFFSKNEIKLINIILGTGQLDFEMFCTMSSRFMVEEEDPEAMRQELREAFRLYDKEGNGYITTDTLKEIFKELDNTIDEDDLDDMIDEIDEDGSGTVDFEEFFGVMTGAD